MQIWSEKLAGQKAIVHEIVIEFGPDGRCLGVVGWSDTTRQDPLPAEIPERDLDVLRQIPLYTFTEDDKAKPAEPPVQPEAPAAQPGEVHLGMHTVPEPPALIHGQPAVGAPGVPLVPLAEGENQRRQVGFSGPNAPEHAAPVDAPAQGDPPEPGSSDTPVKLVSPAPRPADNLPASTPNPKAAARAFGTKRSK
jgi:hypothetical protein